MLSTSAAPGWQPAVASGARAGFRPRLGADLIDAVILTLAYLMLFRILHLSGVFVSLLISLAYFTCLEGGPTGQTFGKKAMQIRVVSLADGQPLGYQRALLRALGRMLSATLFYVGYLWMLRSRERQTWHDMLADAVVVPVWACPVVGS